MATTTNLSDFGMRELDMAADLLKAYANNGAPDTFYDDEVVIMMNTHSGNVFITNSDCQVLMENNGILEMFYNTPYKGIEGFADELLENLEGNTDYWHKDDMQYLVDCEILNPREVDKQENPNTYAALIEHGFIEDDEQ